MPWCSSRPGLRQRQCRACLWRSVMATGDIWGIRPGNAGGRGRAADSQGTLTHHAEKSAIALRPARCPGMRFDRYEHASAIRASMGHGTEPFAKVVGPQHNREHSFPKRELQISDCEEPASEPCRAGNAVLFDPDWSFHSVLPNRRLTPRHLLRMRCHHRLGRVTTRSVQVSPDSGEP